ncbi:MAG: S8 family serine peptidase [Acidobacteria bacterium]|nr:S8 family serine peptidase [Acidobacteriota bacterium]
MRKHLLAPVFVALICALTVPAAAPSGGERAHPALRLRFAAGEFRPDDSAPIAPVWFQAAPAGTSAGGRRYLVAMTAAPLSPEERAQMEASGAQLLGYVPDGGYRLRVSPYFEDDLRALPFVEWLGETPSHFKVHPDLATIASAGAGGSAVRIRVILESDEDAGRSLDMLRGLAERASASGKDGAWRVEAEIPAPRLASILSRLAGLPEVEAIEPVRPMRALNQDAVWVHQSFVGPSPQQTPIFNQGIFGCGQTLALADTGQDYDACFFRDAVNGAPPISLCLSAPCPTAAPALSRRKDILYYNWSGTPTGDDDTCPATIGGSGHGTHTSGSLAGDASPFADCAGFTTSGRNGGDGQAPGAKLIVEEMGDGLEYLNNNGGTLWNLADVAYRTGARIHSDSWGGACHDAFGTCIPGCTLPYDSFARDADLAMWTYPDLLMVIAAGNAGQFCPAPISVNSPGIAKNVVTAGSVGHGASADFPSSFSSPGPVFDGRLKPTVASQGESVVSAASDANPASNNCSTCQLDGTSMATPTTAGLAALVREYYTAGYYAAGARSAGAGFVPSGALLKATLIDGAVALGPSAPRPDFDAGYGRVLLNATLAFTGSPFKLRADDHREGITTGSVVTHAYDVAAGTPFRTTLVWTDYPAALGAAVARVNELKLEVVDPNGAVWFQTIDAGSGAPKQTSNPIDAHDALNVEERIVWSAPAAGRWIVRVRGVAVPWGPQPFALLVRGAITDCPAPAAPAAPTLSTPAQHQVQVSWGAVPGAAAYNVYRSLGACPGAPWIPVASGVTGTSALDTTVSGGAAYSYYVAAASDSNAACESPRSPCASIVPTGDCTLDPDFRGVTGASSAGTAGCGVVVTWDPASAHCGSDVRYNVYRGTAAGFVPSPSNRVARCVIGTSFTDTIGLATATTYHYVVRAEDATSGHGGPCRGGNEEGNAAEAGTAPFGPPVIGTFTDDAGDTGVATFSPAPPWTIATTGGHLGPRVYTAASNDSVCSDLTSPVLTLDSPASGPTLSFATIHDLEYDPVGLFGAEGSVGQVEIATGPGFTNWTRVPLTPDYPALVEFPLNNCTTTGNVDNYFSDTNLTYTTYTASLANWAGGDVRIRFRLSGDLLYPGGHWWIDEVRVTRSLVPSACSTVAAGPPPIPDGATIPGQPLSVTMNGGNLVLAWDAARCPASAVNVYWGHLGSFGSFAGGVCNLPASGSATISLPNNVWFLVAATDGGAIDGSWAKGGNGAEKIYAGASAACPAIAQHVTNNGCP